MAEYAKRLEANHEPTVANITGFVNGVSIPVQCSDDPLAQAAIFNHDTISPLGKVMLACLNYP